MDFQAASVTPTKVARDRLAADLGVTAEPPDATAIALAGDVKVERVARHDRSTEAALLDAHEVKQLVRAFSAEVI